jgi:futalosine hydrolase
MSKVLIIVSTPLEAQPILATWGMATQPVPAWKLLALSPEVDLVISGVGKANAAGAAARLVSSEHGCVLNLGIGGVLPGSAAQVGEHVLGTSSVFADEGVPCPDGRFLSCAALGFGLHPSDGTDGFAMSEAIARRLQGVSGHRGVIATVSECSGTDARAAAIVARTGAIAEGMEGAAVGLVAARLGVAWGEIRVVSNTTGDRERQQWRMKEASELLGPLAQEVAGRLQGL